jgi:acetyl-CoA synthetase
MPILGYRGRFDAEKAYYLLEKYGVRNSFLFPTALKLMMKAFPSPKARFDISLRSIMSAGESVGVTVFEWASAELGVTINEMFGQTEINYVVGNCRSAWPAKPGSIGRPYPGHRVAVVDDKGNELKRGELGEIAVNRFFNGQPDPVFFLEYWKNAQATKDKFIGDWGCTGDQAKMDEDGYLWYQGRSDDVIKSAGYRIGPAEIESCLVKHPAVLNAAVIGKPDATRGSIVKAFVVLQPGSSASEKLIDEIQNHVKGRLAPYEYPREIEFVDALPMTTSGKVQRKELRKLEEAKLRKA